MSRRSETNRYPKFYTVKEAAEMLRVSPRTVQALCQKGMLGCSRPGRAYLIPHESLTEYLKIIQ